MLLRGDYLARRTRQILMTPNELDTVDDPFTLFRLLTRELLQKTATWSPGWLQKEGRVLNDDEFAARILLQSQGTVNWLSGGDTVLKIETGIKQQTKLAPRSLRLRRPM
jgi:hypothetical protein